MNGVVNGVAAPPGLWSEARNAEGRVYYYNTVTKATQWTKPLELMTPAEVSLLGSIISPSTQLIASSELWQTSHGRNTPQKVEGTLI